MPRRCSVCADPRLREIQALLDMPDAKPSRIARAFGLSRTTLFRHIAEDNRGHTPTTSPQPAQGRRRVALPGRTAPAATPRRVAAVKADPVETFRRAFDQEPMPHQVEYLTERRSTLVLKGRQVGMTQAAAALAIDTALSRAGALVVIISPSQRQSTEVGARARSAMWHMGIKLAQDTTALLRTDSGSRIVALPGNARGVRGYAADLLILDEAAWIEHDTYTAAFPIVSATGGRLIVQSSPAGPTGDFYELWEEAGPEWHRIRIASADVPTIDPAFLERQRHELSPNVYAQEYLADFGAVTELGRQMFNEERLLKAVSDIRLPGGGT